MKKEKLMILVVPILCVLLIGLSYMRINNDLKDTTSDSIKFKKEYENLNDKKSLNDKNYLNINIDSKNNIKYSNFDEIIDIIKNKTGIIYLGFPECPWCRNVVPVLLEASNKNNVDTIYYLNIKNERSSYEVVDGMLSYKLDENKKEIKGSEGYLKLLDVLDEYLDDYKIEKDGEVYETGEKRLYAPTVIFVRDGEIINLHVSTVESQKDPYKKLTNEQHDELLKIFEESIQTIKKSSCSTNSAC